MHMDSEFAGILVALAFVILAFVGMPSIGTAFLLVALAVGLAVGVLLHFTGKG
jgi:hypothetical protein